MRRFGQVGRPDDLKISGKAHGPGGVFRAEADIDDPVLCGSTGSTSSVKMPVMTS
jgi:hypothetical protein